jgi:hypothetical protein
MATQLQMVRSESSERAPAPIVHERRTACRFHTVMRMARVSRTGDAGLWRVRNISDDGMMLLASVPVSVGERLRIGLSDSVSLEGRAVWWDGERCGVALDQPIDCVSMLKGLVEEQKRSGYRPPRLPVSIRAILYGEQRLNAIHVTNISQHGVGFTHDGSIRAGSNGKLVLPSGREHRGVIRWSVDGHAGMYLIEPISPAALESTAQI